MAENVRLVDPNRLDRNPENPRLIFRSDELQSLQDSIAQQGILVPLTVYEGEVGFFVLDGERRWRCAIKLGLDRVPVIVQPKPDRLTNLMMMFAIHNARKDWDPLPTALKLEAIEEEYERISGSGPSETQLAGLASLSRGEVRRLKKLLSLPSDYRSELLRELEKPRHEQVLTVDKVLEATRGAESLRKREIIDGPEEDDLRRAIIEKFRTGVVRNTVAPRQLARIARAVERGEVSRTTARSVALRLTSDAAYTVEAAFRQSVEQIDYEHGIDQLIQRLNARLDEHAERGYEPSDKLRQLLSDLSTRLGAFGS